MDKQSLTSSLKQIATLLEVKGENSFRIKSYSSAVRAIETFEGSYEDLLVALDEFGVKGIGKGVASQILEAELNGSFALLDELLEEFPASLLDLLKVSGLGAKKLSALYHEKKISSLEQLEAALNDGSLSDLKGFGGKTIENFISSIEQLKSYSGFFMLSQAKPVAERILQHLSNASGCSEVRLSGSVRRNMETVRNINISLFADSEVNVIDALENHPEVEKIISSNSELVRAVVTNKIELLIHNQRESEDCYLKLIGPENHFHHLELRSEEFNCRLERSGLKLEDGSLITDDHLIYKALSLEIIQPELRDLECIETAANLSAANLISEEQIAGILHAHTTYSDGKNSLREMAKTAAAQGYQYLGVTDHSKSAAYAGGLSVEEIKRQHEEIDKLNEELAPFVIFKGIESDILKNGELDYSDAVLDTFDFIIASVHNRFTMSETEQTTRIINAVKNPYTTILGHMTGRLLLRREAYALDIEAVIAAAAESGTCIEINANPRRLDLDWRFHRLAVDSGVSLPINPDAHRIEGYDDISYGVAVARKSGLSASNVLNSMNKEKISDYFKNSRNF